MKIGRNQFAGLVDETGGEGTIALTWDVHRYDISEEGEIYVTGKEYWGMSFPLTDDELFLSFVRLGSRGNPSPKRVLGWVREHGLLTLRDGHRGDQAPISLDDFRSEVRQAREMLGLYAELKARDTEAVVARLSETRPPFDFAWTRHSRSKNAFESTRYWLRNVEEMDQEAIDLYAGYDTLASALTERLKGINMHLSANFPDIAVVTDGVYKIPESAYGLTQMWRCPDLLSGLYLQFYLMISRDRHMRRCDNPVCGLPFPLTRKDKRFCNATCRSNSRNYPEKAR